MNGKNETTESVRYLVIQFHPSKYPSFSRESALALFESVAEEQNLDIPRTEVAGEGADEYINACYESEDPRALWMAIESRLFEEPTHGDSLRQSLIVVCQGESGWDDYLLLHTFAEGEQLDSFGAAAE